MGRSESAMLRILVVALALLALASAEGENYPASANLDASGPAAQKSLPIKYHTVGGLNRIDLDDDAADDATYRAFQLARYNGDAMMQIQAHEEEFERKEREEAELGEAKQHSDKYANDERSEKWNKKHDSRYNEIMGANGDDDSDEELLEVGEAKDRLGEGDGAATKEPFDAVHVAKSGDIEDHDAHFVMTDGLRHRELKRAVLMESEDPDEKQSQKLAKQMESEKAAIEKFRLKQMAKDESDESDLEVKQEVSDGLKRHHLMLDKEGRVVPDFE